MTIFLSTDSEDLTFLRNSIAEILEDTCDSLAVHEFVDGKNDLSSKLRDQANKLGWFSIGLPEQLGGFDFGFRGAGLLHNELGRAVAPGSYIATLAAIDVIALHGDAEQQDAWLEAVISGEVKVAIAALAMAEHAVVEEDHFVSTKLKLLGEADAEIALIPLETGEIGIVDISGSDRLAMQVWDRTRTVLEVSLEKAPLLGKLMTNGRANLSLSRNALMAVAADSIGLGRGIIEKTIAYMKEREQFGRAIGSFQALKHRAVDMVARIDVAEHVLGNALDVAEAGDAAADMWAALAKVSATQAATFVASDCVQIFGGVGFTWEYDVHLYLKRARMNEMLIGTNDQLLDWAADELAQLTQAGHNVLELSAI